MIDAPDSPPVAPARQQRMDRVKHVEVSLLEVPLARPVADAKVLTGRQKALSHVSMLDGDERDGQRRPRIRLQLFATRRRARVVRAC
jgi:hypothetical protein